ncbi:MAG: hypothetical protein ACRDRJ_36270 [Streptosporangiaceae bacterium]
MRTAERDLSALQQSGVPIYAEPGRTGGYCLDKARTLPPVNLTPGAAVAAARGPGHPGGGDQPADPELAAGRGRRREHPDLVALRSSR